jgi:hypothetical protein
MISCAGLGRLSREGKGWPNCPREAIRGDRFCAAAGSGKSKALLMEAFAQAIGHPGVNTLLLRRTLHELERSLLLYFRRDGPRELYRSFNESRHTVTWLNGSSTQFGYCQRENDVYGFVARIHRLAADHTSAMTHPGEFEATAHSARAETQVFLDHHDLVDFLHHEFAKDCAGK